MPINGSATADLFEGIHDLINARLGVTKFQTLTAALELAARNPFVLDGEEFVHALFDQLDKNWTSVLPRLSRAASSQNFRWCEPKVSIAPHNRSPEVTLERALICACVDAKRDDWSNQVPLISGIAGPHAYKRRAIDLVHRMKDGGFEFVELKVKNGTPAYAAIEILTYGLLWLLSRRDRSVIGYSSNPILDASIIQLSVLAPAKFYIRFEHQELSVALNSGLSLLGSRFGVQMGLRQMAFPEDFRWSPASPEKRELLLNWLDRREPIKPCA
jgi:hypothetical protein